MSSFNYQPLLASSQMSLILQLIINTDARETYFDKRLSLKTEFQLIFSRQI